MYFLFFQLVVIFSALFYSSFVVLIFVMPEIEPVQNDTYVCVYKRQCIYVYTNHSSSSKLLSFFLSRRSPNQCLEDLWCHFLQCLVIWTRQFNARTLEWHAAWFFQYWGPPQPHPVFLEGI